MTIASGAGTATSTTAKPSAPEKRAWYRLKLKREKKGTGLIQTERAKERFIPVTQQAIIDQLTQPGVWPAEQLPHVRRFFSYLKNWRHISYHERLTRVEGLYLPFSPDRDTVRIRELPAAERRAQQANLVEALTGLLERANYDVITEADLNRFLTEDSPYGLKLQVDMEEFDELLLFSRGAAIETHRQRSPKKLYVGFDQHQVAVFSRLFVLVKLKPDEVRVREIMQKEKVDSGRAKKILAKQRKVLPEGCSTEHIYLKLFKNIPQMDIEMMFPNTKVAFRPFDKLKLGVTASGGTIAGLVSAAPKILALSNPVTAMMAMFGLVGLFVRQVMNFFNTRNRYMMQLSQNLYFHNLANNRAVLTLLSNRAEEEDIKEEVLLYCVLAKESVHRSEISDLKGVIEDFLKETFDVDVDYEIDDALSRLVADGIVVEDAEGNLRALAPDEGTRLLDELWDGFTNVDSATDRAAFTAYGETGDSAFGGGSKNSVAEVRETAPASSAPAAKAAGAPERT